MLVTGHCGMKSKCAAIPAAAFLMEIGQRRQREREGSHCSCSGFYWFAISSPFAIRTFFELVRMTMVRRLVLLLRVLPGERERLLDWKQPCDHRPEALDWCSPAFDGGPTILWAPNWGKAPPFEGLWRPKVSMVVTTVSHCFWTILDGARFYDDGDGLEGLPRGCTWRAGSIRGLTSRPRVCWPGCNPLGTGLHQVPSPGGWPCLYLEQECHREKECVIWFSAVESSDNMREKKTRLWYLGQRSRGWGFLQGSMQADPEPLQPEKSSNWFL